MNSRRPSVRKGLLPRLKGLWEALADRSHRVLQVIDEALDSDNLKDRIWAVEWILKRTPDGAPAKPTTSRKAPAKPVEPEVLNRMSDAELLARIRYYLDGPAEPES